MDLVFGTDRTHSLAVMSLANEVVSPIYQLYAILQHTGGQAYPKSAKLIAAASILVTVCMRAPICLGLFYLAIRDSLRYYLDAMRGGTSTKSSDSNHDASLEVLRKEVQPILLIPGAMGTLLMLYLDSKWVTDWALPKVFEHKRI